jgi:Domain of unknown function (DUF4129)
MVVVAEAAWVSLLLGAAYNGADRPPVDLPFLALALPAAAAVAVTSWGGRVAHRWFGNRGASVEGASLSLLGRRPTSGDGSVSRRARVRQSIRGWLPIWWRAEVLVLVPVVVIGMAITAGLISELSVTGSFGRVAVEPWSSVGHRPAVVAGAAWIVSILAWVRGIWLGRFSLTLRHALWSLAAAGVAFIGIFAGRATNPSAQYGAATGAAGWLFFISFPFMAAAIALVHQRDLERAVLTRASTHVNGAWVAVLAVPMAGVALVSLLLAVLIGPAAPILGRAITRAGKAVGSALVAAIRWLWNLLPRGHAKHAPLLGPKGGLLNRLRILRVPPPHHHPYTPNPVIGEVILALLVAALLYFVLRHVRFRRLARRAMTGEAEERDSLFSWQHLFDQIRAAFVRLASRLRPRRRRSRAIRSADEPVLPLVSTSVDPRTVREVYRRMLVAARDAGAGRGTAETSHELASRFTNGLELSTETAEHLLHLTERYEAVRYGNAPNGDHEEAALDAGVVIPALRVALAPDESDRLGDETPGTG